MRCSISPGSSVRRLCLTRGNFILIVVFKFLHRCSISQTKWRQEGCTFLWRLIIFVSVFLSKICPRTHTERTSPLVVGLYIEQICVACLLFLKAKDGGVAAIVQAVFMLVLLVLTFSARMVIHNSYSRKFSSYTWACRSLKSASAGEIFTYVTCDQEDGTEILQAEP